VCKLQQVFKTDPDRQGEDRVKQPPICPRGFSSQLAPSSIKDFLKALKTSQNVEKIEIISKMSKLFFSERPKERRNANSVT
jgi:hypothetical protein